MKTTIGEGLEITDGDAIPLLKLIAWIKENTAGISDDELAKWEVCPSCDYDTNYGYLYISRDETKEETLAREERGREQRKAQAAQAEAREKAQLEALLRKYPNTQYPAPSKP